MRWQGQKIADDDGAALLPMKGLVRSVRTPDFEGVTFHEVAAKSALNRVPEQSNMPFRWTVNPTRGCLHRCVYCLSPETLVLMADGRHKPIGEIQVGDRVVGTELRGRYRYFVATDVSAAWRTRKRAQRITLADGTELVASRDHRFLTEHGWKFVAQEPGEVSQRPHLTVNNRLMGFGLGGALSGYMPPQQSLEYRRGYLCGMIRGDGMLVDRTYTRESTGKPYRVTIFRLALADSEALIRSHEFLAAEGVSTTFRPFTTKTEKRAAMTGIFTATRGGYQRIKEVIRWPETLSEDWCKGFLSGIFDAEGSLSGSALRVSNKDDEILWHLESALGVLGIPFVREPVAPKGVTTIRITGGRASYRRFFQLTDPPITRKLTLLGKAVKTFSDLRVQSVEDLGSDQDMVDITTGTGDFIANGVISHNCFARKTHEYLDLDSGKDFDTQIVVKTNIAEVLRAEVNKPSWKREHVALGTNTDPYQRAEGRYQLMPGIIRALAESGTPFSILTKGPLLKRDLPLLVEAAQHVPVSVAVSLAMTDPQLQQKVEPGTPDPRARLNLIKAITNAGLECNVLAMPILPWLTDSTAALDQLHASLAEAGANWVSTGALHLRPGAREWFMQWLAAEYPELVPKYRRIYRSAKGRFSTYVSAEYRQWLGKRAAEARRRHGFERRSDVTWRERVSPEKPLDSPGWDASQSELPGLELTPTGQPALF
ncbi:intein-containing Rv2578c family radical SAM protein [Nesterenkonia massiliensis]|uniref:intein-containing Rv2578c family radical SAM protein n=1 Tax=Nesterenkonia massiliensis TaxID=1232429 RepID=UPI0004253BDF|nr:intein-containing Rv2578c family radical SAM protein [Nesterenkonia massiliensis]